MPQPRMGEKLPLVRMPTFCPSLADVGPVAQRLAAVGHQAAQAPRRAVGPLLLEGGAPGERALVPADHPGQPRLERRDAGAQLVPVQRKSRLEAQRVARTETGGDDALREQCLPEARRHLGGDGALDAVLTGVARAGHQAGRTAPFEAFDVEAVHRSRRWRHAGQESPRLGALHGDHGPLLGYVGPPDRAEHVARVGGVGHDVEAVLVDPPDDHVVDDEAVLVEQVRVLRPSRVDAPRGRC